MLKRLISETIKSCFIALFSNNLRIVQEQLSLTVKSEDCINNRMVCRLLGKLEGRHTKICLLIFAVNTDINQKYEIGTIWKELDEHK